MYCLAKRDKTKVLKRMGKTTIKDKSRDNTAAIIAEIHGVSSDYVRKVRNGVREDEEILATLVDYHQMHSKLIKHLKELVPVKSNPDKYGR